MSLEAEVQRRNITEVVHFTTNRGLTGALAKGLLLSRPKLKAEEYLRHVLKLNSAIRPEEAQGFDKSEDWVAFVNLSVSEVNARFLNVSRGWHVNAEVWWCILAFDAEILTHDNVWFATTNNGYPLCERAKGVEGFLRLFKALVPRKMGNGNKLWSAHRGGRNDRLPTCEQAEVLYPGEVSLKFLRTIYVEDEAHQDTVRGWLSEFGYHDIEVIVGAEKFKGMPN